nr:triple gene block protein 2 [Chrysanthemum virus B]WBY54307.1 MAG: triple gene block protein 2 [Chrysanthemum virus B]WBY54313.1 MAG: triple gene block protein 2 [Chrysanthemum virus B]WBY54319.1 MAG: triple gene block protein 2 [Chrysanthemum virus B]
MPLTPPPDHTKVLLVAAIGLSIVASILTYSRNTLPQVGDHSHLLPHGGVYKDGTKTIVYGGPRKLNSLEGGFNLPVQPWFLVILLSAAIFLLSCRSGHRRCICGQCH